MDYIWNQNHKLDWLQLLPAESGFRGNKYYRDKIGHKEELFSVQKNRLIRNKGEIRLIQVLQLYNDTLLLNWDFPIAAITWRFPV